ncbi:MAG: TIM barrel protein [Eubacteriales bacterium]
MSNKAKFGPGGNSESFYAEGGKHTFQAPAWVAQRGLDAYEYSGENGITGSEATFRKIGEEAVKHGVSMSLHTPYYISLSGTEIDKRLRSIDYIEKSQNAAVWLGADTIVIHTGSAAKITREQAMELASDTLYKALEKLPDEGVFWGLETMGKINQLGTLDEVLTLCAIDRRLRPVVDFGHLNSRQAGNAFLTRDDYMRVFDKISNALGADIAFALHCHFSKIEYTKAGEKRHLTFADQTFGPNFEPLMEAIAQNGLAPRIICESDGTMAEDALTMKKYYLSLIK